MNEPLSVVDMHTAGEPVRIVVGGYPKLHSRTIIEKRREAAEKHDHLRRMMMLEPRGHAGMYGVIPTAPCDPRADLAVLFAHAEGYSTMCGHATIAVARWAVESGRVTLDEANAFRLECPCGVVDVSVSPDWRSASFVSVPSFAFDANQLIEVPGFGKVEVDLAYGGAFYAILPSKALGLDWETTPFPDLARAAGATLAAARKQVIIPDVVEEDLSFLYGVILTDGAEWPQPTRNICIFATGQIDRSPTGSGVTARVALDVLCGRAQMGVPRRFVGPTGEAFIGVAVAMDEAAPNRSIQVRVNGAAYYTGSATLSREDGDPLGDGFLLSQEVVA